MTQNVMLKGKENLIRKKGSKKCGPRGAKGGQMRYEANRPGRGEGAGGPLLEPLGLPKVS